jgi:hypothetical protein
MKLDMRDIPITSAGLRNWKACRWQCGVKSLPIFIGIRKLLSTQMKGSQAATEYAERLELDLFHHVTCSFIKKSKCDITFKKTLLGFRSEDCAKLESADAKK